MGWGENEGTKLFPPLPRPPLPHCLSRTPIWKGSPTPVPLLWPGQRPEAVSSASAQVAFHFGQGWPPTSPHPRHIINVHASKILQYERSRHKKG
jgi:hypothetical protein